MISLLILTCIAQAQSLDSLRSALKTAQGEERLIVMDELCFQFRYSDRDSTTFYARKGYKESKRLSSKKYIASFSDFLAKSLYIKADYDSAIFYHKQALQLSSEIGDSSQMIKSLGNLGSMYYAIGDYELANEYMLEAHHYHELNGATALEMSASFNNLGAIQARIGNYVEARDYYLASIRKSYEAKHTHSLASVYHNLGVLYAEDIHDFDSATYYFNQALPLRYEVGRRFDISGTLLKFGRLYQEMKQSDSAIHYFQESIKEGEVAGANAMVLEATHEMARSYFGVGDYRRSLHLATQTSDGLDTLSTLKIRRNNERLLADIYQAIHKEEMALVHLERYIQFKDSLMNVEKDKAIRNLELRYETEKKQNEIEQLSKQQALDAAKIRQRNTYAVSITTVLFMVVGFGYMFNRKKSIQSKKEKVDLEQKLLRSQLNPHFIFNSLMAIEDFIYKNEAKEAGVYLSSFAKLMRLILDNSREDAIPLEQEIETLRRYLDLQKLRLGDTFDYEFQIDEKLDTTLTGIPPMFAQPFIENALEHGFRDLEKKGVVTISFKLKNDKVLLAVEDNGVGIIGEGGRKKGHTYKSMAMMITKERLAVINRDSKRKTHLEIDALNKRGAAYPGTSIKFYFPLVTI